MVPIIVGVWVVAASRRGDNSIVRRQHLRLGAKITRKRLSMYEYDTVLVAHQLDIYQDWHEEECGIDLYNIISQYDLLQLQLPLCL